MTMHALYKFTINIDMTLTFRCKLKPCLPQFSNHTRYRAMHYSAKRGLAIACRLSVRLSVCDVGGS